MMACPLFRMSIAPSAGAIISSRDGSNFELAIGDEDDDDGESNKKRILLRQHEQRERDGVSLSKHQSFPKSW